MIQIMPLIKSAIKKLKQDKKRTVTNKPYRVKMRLAVKTMRLTKTKNALKGAFQALDKAVKKHIIHKNRATRIKSRLNKLVK